MIEPQSNMSLPPSRERDSFFVDDQNFFHSIKEAFNYRYPNYDIQKLAHSISEKQGWGIPVSIHFYTGVPRKSISPEWHEFWRRKMDRMKEKGIYTFSRSLFYSKTKVNSGKTSKPVLVGREKGIDVRLALDVTREVFEDKCNVAVILSQNQDLSEVAKEVRYIARREKCWIKIASAFPVSETYDNNRGINNTD